MKKSKKVSNLGLAVASDSMPRNVYFDLEDDETKILEGMKIGQMVVMVVRGKISSLSKRESKGTGGSDVSGTLRIDNPDFEVTTQSAWDALADDSDD